MPWPGRAFRRHALQQVAQHAAELDVVGVSVQSVAALAVVGDHDPAGEDGDVEMVGLLEPIIKAVIKFLESMGFWEGGVEWVEEACEMI